MRKKPTSEDVVCRLGELAFGKANDVVKLATSECLMENELKKLDLSLLSELKRGSNGTIEVKLVNRIEALKLLAELLGAGSERASAQAESFYAAMESSAGGSEVE